MGETHNFLNTELVATNGKFYMEFPTNHARVIEVSEYQFRIFMLTVYNNRNIAEFNRSFEYCLSQLDMTPSLFQATLFDAWTIDL